MLFLEGAEQEGGGGGGGRGQAIKKNRTFGIFFLIYRSGKQKYKEIFNFIQNIDVSR